MIDSTPDLAEATVRLSEFCDAEDYLIAHGRFAGPQRRQHLADLRTAIAALSAPVGETVAWAIKDGRSDEFITRFEDDMKQFAENDGKPDCVIQPLYAAPPPAPHVPEGWRLVPVEATEAMEFEGNKAGDPCISQDAAYDIDLSAKVWNAMLSAAPAAPSVGVGGWRDIASAPRDGKTYILCSSGGDYDIWTARWSTDYPPGEAYFTTADGMMTLPTHWQPLPPPPEGAR